MICCVLLASGFSRRFGSNKLLFGLNGEPMYMHSLKMLKQLESMGGVRVVVVSQYDEIERQAEKLGFDVIHNENADEGISASVKHGVRASEGDEWTAFFTADQPYLKAQTVNSFFANALQSGKTLGSVMSCGTPGNPTLFHARWRDELLELTGDKGGRKILKANDKDVFKYEIDEYERQDIDFSK